MPPHNSMPLPDERHPLVTGNLGLAYQFSKDHRGIIRDHEEANSTSLMGLVLAARTYDPSRGVKFSTYAYETMKNLYMRERHARLCPKRFCSGERKLLHSNLPARPDHTLRDRHNRELVDSLLKKMASRRYEMVLRLHYLEGKNAREIGELLGVSREYARQMTVRAMAMLRRTAHRQRLSA